MSLRLWFIWKGATDPSFRYRILHAFDKASVVFASSAQQAQQLRARIAQARPAPVSGRSSLTLRCDTLTPFLLHSPSSPPTW